MNGGGDLGMFDDGRHRRRRRASSGESVLRVLIVAVAALAVYGVWTLVFSSDSGAFEILVIDASGGPVPGAVVTAASGGRATTSEDGVAAIDARPPVEITIMATGHRPVTVSISEAPAEAATVTIEPYVLSGRVVDSAGVGLAGAVVEAGSLTTVADESGAFRIVGVEPGPVTVTRFGWEPIEVSWTGDDERLDFRLEPLVVRAVRVHERVAGTDFGGLLALIEGTTVNSLVFDTKIESGHVVHDIDVPAAGEAGAIVVSYDPAVVLEASHARGLYTITRIVTFQDPIVAQRHPEWAISDTGSGGVWRNHAGHAWLDPTNREAWEYPLDLGVAACRLGFDEVQFDYVRFPSDGDVSTAAYAAGPMNAQTRVETIAAFLDEARRRIHPEGCAVSADIFGIITTAANDQGIGQRIEELSVVTDALSPMIYPSHYGRGWGGYDDPNDHPFAMVTLALEAGLPKMQGSAVMRPWLQAFFWSGAQVRESIEAAERLGVGWMLWNATSEYRREWLPSE